MTAWRLLKLLGLASFGFAAGIWFQEQATSHAGILAIPSKIEQVLGNNITLALLISIAVLISSWRRDRLTLSGNLNKQIQDYNLAIFKDAALANHISKLFPGRDGSWVQGLYSVFYFINMIRDGKHIKEKLYTSSEFHFEDDEMVRMIADDYPEQIIFILDGERGYGKEFKNYLWAQLAKSHDEAWIASVRYRLSERTAKTRAPSN